MGMIKCKECSAKISSKAESCPHCGVKVKKGISIVNIIIMLVLFFLAIPFISECGNRESRTVTTSSSPSLSFTRSNVKNMLLSMCENNYDPTIEISCDTYATFVWDESIYETCKNIKNNPNSVKACAITMIRWKVQK